MYVSMCCVYKGKDTHLGECHTTVKRYYWFNLCLVPSLVPRPHPKNPIFRAGPGDEATLFPGPHLAFCCVQ